MLQADRRLGPISVVRCAHCHNRTGLTAGLVVGPGVILCSRCFRERTSALGVRDESRA